MMYRGFVATGMLIVLLMNTPAILAGDQIQLTLPENVLDLPKLKSERFIVHEPTGWDDFTFHDRPLITKWKGKLYVTWNCAARSEESRPITAMICHSPDSGKTWSTPIRFAISGEAVYERHMREFYHIPKSISVVVNTGPICMHPTQDRLYIFSTAWIEKDTGRANRGRAHYTTDGKVWKEVTPGQLDKEIRKPLRHHWSSHRFFPLADGRLMASTPDKSGRVAFTEDTSGLSGWRVAKIDSRRNSVGCSAWQGPDGTLHYVGGDRTHLWHAYSNDNGQTWSPLSRQTQFVDNLGGFAFGTLPKGVVWYLGTPIPHAARYPLVFAMSRDGWDFAASFLIRDEPFHRKYPWAAKGARPGYEYPDAIYDDNKLLVVFANCRDLIELNVVDISAFSDNQGGPSR